MPSWLSTFISDWLSVSPFFAISDAIWNALMTACTGLMTTTPQWFSTEAWQYVRFELYPWALSIGIASLNLFFIMGFFKAASNLKENITLELLIESLFKLVVLNVLLVNGLTIITTLFNMSSALAGNVMMTCIFHRRCGCRIPVIFLSVWTAVFYCGAGLWISDFNHALRTLYQAVCADCVLSYCNADLDWWKRGGAYRICVGEEFFVQCV